MIFCRGLAARGEHGRSIRAQDPPSPTGVQVPGVRRVYGDGALACEGYDGFGWCLAMYSPLVESLPGPPTEGNHDRLTAVLLAKRQHHAAEPKALRAKVLPVLVIGPHRMHGPQEGSDEISPTYAISGGDLPARRPRDRAVNRPRPRKPCRSSTLRGDRGVCAIVAIRGATGRIRACSISTGVPSVNASLSSSAKGQPTPELLRPVPACPAYRTTALQQNNEARLGPGLILKGQPVGARGSANGSMHRQALRSPSGGQSHSTGPALLHHGDPSLSDQRPAEAARTEQSLRKRHQGRAAFDRAYARKKKPHRSIAARRTRSPMFSFRLPSRLGAWMEISTARLCPVRIIDAERNGSPVCVKAHKKLLLPPTRIGMGS